jgi:hypothetical protein
MISVLGLPRPFVLRIDRNDPHPAPWLRVKLCCLFGERLYPHAQWRALFELWRGLHPLPRGGELESLAAHASELVDLLLAQSPPRLAGRSLAALLRDDALAPERLERLFARAVAEPALLSRLPPCTACAVLGHARVAGQLSPEAESALLGRLLVRWALTHNTVPDTANFEEDQHGNGRDRKQTELHL